MCCLMEFYSDKIILMIESVTYRRCAKRIMNAVHRAIYVTLRHLVHYWNPTGKNKTTQWQWLVIGIICAS